MKKFQLFMNKGEVANNTYRVSRYSSAYTYFVNEFHDFSCDYYGNIIVPDTEKKEKSEGKLQQIFNQLKEALQSERKSFVAPFGSDEYSFFDSEYNLAKDNNYNIIVPEEINSSLKRM